MFGSLATTLAPFFAGATSDSAATAAPDTVTIDTGDVTPTVGGGVMSLAGPNATSMTLWIVAGLALLLLVRR